MSLGIAAGHPGTDPAVVEAHHPAVPQRDRPPHPLDAPDDVGPTFADRHQVGDATSPLSVVQVVSRTAESST